MRVLVMVLGALLSAGGTARAQLVDAVKVETGLVKGTLEDGLSVFRGIPYAAPPVGNLRWRAPQPAGKWEGDTVEKAGAAWAESAGGVTLADLRAMPADKVMASAPRQRGVSWPIPDGWVVPDDQYKLYEARRYNDVPVLIGYNSDEGATFGVPASQSAYVQSVKERYASFADKLLTVYPGGDTTAAVVSATR